MRLMGRRHRLLIMSTLSILSVTETQFNSSGVIIKTIFILK